MENRFQVRLNVCKSWNCVNLGVPDAPDYVFPVYRLGYPALGCGACGSLPPLFNEPECNAWFGHLFAHHLGLTGQGCPRGCHARLIRYGANRSGSPRLQCVGCNVVFTPWRGSHAVVSRIEHLLAALDAGNHQSDTTGCRALRQAALMCESAVMPPVARIATRTLTLPFQGERRDCLLYVILSADADSGQILQVSTNYSPWPVGESLRYQVRTAHPPVNNGETLEERVRNREALFLARSQFDEIRYGYARLKRNDSGAMLRPVIALHGHFQRLKRRFPGVAEHFLDHECVLRGAAITAWASDVRAGATRLWFVVEEGDADAGGAQQPRGSWHFGWWKNHWQLWENATSRKMVSLLTGSDRAYDPQRITLRACDDFISWLAAHPWATHSGRLSAGVISQQLSCLAARYPRHQP